MGRRLQQSVRSADDVGSAENLPKVRVNIVMPSNDSSLEHPSSSAITFTAMEYPETEIETILNRTKDVSTGQTWAA